MVSPYQYIDETGVIVSDTSTLQTEVQDEFLAVFGSDMNTDPSTPQGVLITAETLARKGVVDNNAAVANQINPNIAGGVFLDAICALTGLQRAAATRSTIATVTVTGVPNTIIPAGSKAKTTSNDEFETVSNFVIPISGTGAVNFQSVEYGAIAAPISTLTTIVTNVLGWETVTNPNAAVLGTDEQSDESLRALRKVTLALQGVSLVEALISALNATEGVKSIQFRENIASTVEVIDNVTMDPHSIYACVDGGTDDNVAEALLENKSNGCAYTNGGSSDPVSVVLTDPSSGQDYTILFDRPDLIPFKVKATVRVGSTVADPTNAVIAAILAYAAGTIPNETGFSVGSSVSPFEIAAAVNTEVTGIYVQKMEVTTVAANTFQTTEWSLDIFEQATLISANISVVVL